MRGDAYIAGLEYIIDSSEPIFSLLLSIWAVSKHFSFFGAHNLDLLFASNLPAPCLHRVILASCNEILSHHFLVTEKPRCSWQPEILCIIAALISPKSSLSNSLISSPATVYARQPEIHIEVSSYNGHPNIGIWDNSWQVLKFKCD